MSDTQLHVIRKPGHARMRYVFSSAQADGCVVVQKRWKARLGPGCGPVRRLELEHARNLYRSLLRDGWLPDS